MVLRAVVVGLVLTVIIIIIDVIIVEAVVDTRIGVGKSILVIVVSAGEVFGHYESNTQTPKIEIIVVCYHMNFIEFHSC